jgi:hypothetical protein
MSKAQKILLLTTLLALVAHSAYAQSIYIDASNLVPKVGITFSPRTGSFVESSTFEVPILIDTNGASINGLEVRINYDKDKLEIVRPSSGLSIIGVWVEPPGYDNTRGTASYVGVIPNGITTESGLIGTITFRAKKLGRAVISVSSNSKVLLNNGQGTEAQVELGRGEYTILAKAPEGVNVYSETHPFQGEWYNNKNPVISWEKEAGVSGFSYIMDDKPATVPENELMTEETSLSFENLNDGLFYFHIKAYKNGVWGTAGHFLVRIDSSPPAEFTPEVNYLFAAAAASQRALVSFFTTDNLSGIDRYEVGVIDKSQPDTLSPVFVQAESPFQVAITGTQSVIVRAVDGAGNVRDASVTVEPPSFMRQFLTDNLVYLLILIIAAGLIGLTFHYLVGHHIIRYIRRAFELEREEEQAQEAPVEKQWVNPYLRSDEAADTHPENR